MGQPLKGGVEVKRHLPAPNKKVPTPKAKDPKKKAKDKKDDGKPACAPPAPAKGQDDHSPEELYKVRPRTEAEKNEFCLTFAQRKSQELGKPMAIFGNGMHYAVDLQNGRYLWVNGQVGLNHDDLVNDVWQSNRSYIENHFGKLN